MVCRFGHFKILDRLDRPQLKKYGLAQELALVGSFGKMTEEVC